MRKIVSAIYMVVGLVFFTIGSIGVVLPVLPTTPFLLLATFCFARGSSRINKWFLSTKVYKNHLDTFMRDRSMYLRTKVGLLAFASTIIICAFLAMENIYGRMFIIILIILKYYYFLFKIKTRGTK